jgi:7-cyano-7-deazaguanine synthase
MPEKTSKIAAVVLLSGGMDSSTLLHHVAKTLHHQPIHALSFHYGQRHARELECAQWQALAAGVAHHCLLDVSFFGDVVKSDTSLVNGGADVPALADIAEGDKTQPSTYVPNRNMMLLSIAAAYAEAHGIADVYCGVQAQDEYGYWDCTAEFVEQLNRVLALNRRTAVVVHAPFVAMRKADLLRLGLQLGVDYAQTWSCYRGGAKACGTCPTCVERLKAFREVGVPDPLEYETIP